MQEVKLYGLIKIKGFWLPFAFLGLTAVMGQDPFLPACGILVGHLWYFFTTLLPRGTGQQYLPTPRWVATLASKLGMEGAPVAPPPQQSAPWRNPAAAGFRAFRGGSGGGHRLGS